MDGWRVDAPDEIMQTYREVTCHAAILRTMINKLKNGEMESVDGHMDGRMNG